MTEWAALITAIAALINAIIWPAAIVVLLIIFRAPLRRASQDLPTLLGRVQKFRIGSLEAELVAKAAPLVEEAMQAPGEISSNQIRSAASLKVSAQGIGDAALRAELDRLCIEYETIRKTMPPSNRRTRAMVDVLVRLRTLAPTIEHFLDELKASPSAGKRLAAVAIMQVDPAQADLAWIVDRFRQDSPFLFFEAATILRSVANLRGGSDPAVTEAAREGLAILETFPETPDENTTELLQSIVLRASRS